MHRLSLQMKLSGGEPGIFFDFQLFFSNSEIEHEKWIFPVKYVLNLCPMSQQDDWLAEDGQRPEATWGSFLQPDRQLQ